MTCSRPFVLLLGTALGALLHAPACTYMDLRVGDGLDGGVLVDPADAPPLPPDAMATPGFACSTFCPSPAPGKFMVCAWLTDLETSTVITGTPLQVTFYDALGYANDPSTATPIGAASVDSAGCAVTELGGVTPPFTGFVAVTVDDAPGAPDVRVPTGVAVAAQAGGKATVLAFSARRTTEAAWSAQAGLSPGFAERGAYVPIFIDPTKAPVPPFAGAPVAGVVVTENGAPKPASDYAFSDQDPLARTTVAPGQATTGQNGTALYLDGALVMYSGTGGEPPGCTWPSTLAATIPGALFVQERVAKCP